MHTPNMFLHRIFGFFHLLIYTAEVLNRLNELKLWESICLTFFLVQDFGYYLFLNHTILLTDLNILLTLNFYCLCSFTSCSH